MMTTSGRCRFHVFFANTSFTVCCGAMRGVLEFWSFAAATKCCAKLRWDSSGFPPVLRVERTCRAMATVAIKSAKKQKAEMAKRIYIRRNKDNKVHGFVQLIRFGGVNLIGQHRWY